MEELTVKQRELSSAASGVSEPPPYRRDSELEKRARQVGTIAGQVVSLARKATNFSEPGGAADELRAKASEKAAEIREQVATQAEHWGEVAREKSAELGRRAKARYEQARRNTAQLGHDYPWHVLLAAAVAGIVIGAVLRIRRSHAV